MNVKINNQDFSQEAINAQEQYNSQFRSPRLPEIKKFDLSNFSDQSKADRIPHFDSFKSQNILTLAGRPFSEAFKDNFLRLNNNKITPSEVNSIIDYLKSTSHDGIRGISFSWYSPYLNEIPSRIFDLKEL
jgi:hypothetical protein